MYETPDIIFFAQLIMNLNQVFLILIIHYVAVAINTFTNKTPMKNLNRDIVFNQVVGVEPLHNFAAELLSGLMTGRVESQHHQTAWSTASVTRTPQFIRSRSDPRNSRRSVFENSIGFVDCNGSLLGLVGGLWVLWDSWETGSYGALKTSLRLS